MEERTRLFSAKRILTLQTSLIALPMVEFAQERPSQNIGLILPYKVSTRSLLKELITASKSRGKRSVSAGECEGPMARRLSSSKRSGVDGQSAATRRRMRWQVRYLEFACWISPVWSLVPLP